MDNPRINAVSGTMPGNSSEDVNSTATDRYETVRLETELRLAALAKRLITESTVDADRVKRLTNEIRSGNYRSNPWRMADKLIGMELLMR